MERKGRKLRPRKSVGEISDGLMTVTLATGGNKMKTIDGETWKRKP